MMRGGELDPDVARWGLYDLVDVCALSNSGSRRAVTQFDVDLSNVECVREGYCGDEGCSSVENDAAIACVLQEEFRRLAKVEEEQEQDRGCGGGNGSDRVSYEEFRGYPVEEANDCCFSKEGDEEVDRMGVCSTASSPANDSVDGEELLRSLDIDDESALDGEVGKRLNHMVPVTHVPKINGEIPSADEQISDHQRLLNRLQLYGLDERKVQGDGNCQFRALSDQLYRSSEHHKFVREQVVNQLLSHLELYEGYVPMAYSDYLRKISRSGEWGDHVTLQAAADSYGVKIFVITSFKDTCVIEILPHVQKSTRVICLSFWAEVHYNSIYPEGEMPVDIKKKKKWWKL